MHHHSSNPGTFYLAHTSTLGNSDLGLYSAYNIEYKIRKLCRQSSWHNLSSLKFMQVSALPSLHTVIPSVSMQRCHLKMKISFFFTILETSSFTSNLKANWLFCLKFHSLQTLCVLLHFCLHIQVSLSLLASSEEIYLSIVFSELFIIASKIFLTEVGHIQVNYFNLLCAPSGFLFYIL